MTIKKNIPIQINIGEATYHAIHKATDIGTSNTVHQNTRDATVNVVCNSVYYALDQYVRHDV